MPFLGLQKQQTLSGMSFLPAELQEKTLGHIKLPAGDAVSSRDAAFLCHNLC